MLKFMRDDIPGIRENSDCRFLTSKLRAFTKNRVKKMIHKKTGSLNHVFIVDLTNNRLCFNCTGIMHWMAECCITRSCQKCGGKHHTSICDKEPQQMLLAAVEAVTYPVVVLKVDGITCQALLDWKLLCLTATCQAAGKTACQNRAQEN